MKTGDKIVVRDQPCERCGSSDAKQVYDDGHAYCFSCKHYYATEEEDEEIEPILIEDFKSIDKLPSRGWRDRKITRKIMEVYGVKAEIDASGEPVKTFSPSYDSDNNLIGYR